MKTLAICIPAYKRPEYLRRCIESALISAAGQRISIIVSDDSVDDTNAGVMHALKNQHPWIQWHRNPVNFGIDANIQRAVDLCTDDFAWLIGEDDTFLPGAIGRMFARLQQTPAPFVMANYVYTGEGGRPLGQALSGISDQVELHDFVARHLWAIGFLGACVIDRQRWDDTPVAPYQGTYYTHVGRICELLHGAALPVLIEPEPCVANRVEGTDTFTWKRDSYGVYFGFCAMCRAVAQRCPDLANAMQRAIEEMQRRYGWLSLRLAVRLRSERGYDLAQYRRYLRNSTTNPLKRSCFWLISITPPMIFVPLVRFYRRLRPQVRQPV